MKKLFALILTIIVCLSFAACGNVVSTSKEEMLEQAVELNRAELLETMNANVARAKKEYNDKIVELNDIPVYFKGESTLETQYRISLKPSGYTTLSLRFDLPENEMLEINDGDHISVVGILEVKNSTDATLKSAFLIE
ncbi:MAG: hypothetical protein E7588_10165 [Ruminococcaceae bacterium]|nr:hypothetical protein [Oscillospiraceae bacterium]